MYFECYHSIHRWVVIVEVLYSYSSWNDDGGGFGSNDNSSIDVILCLNAMALWYWTGSFSPPPHVPVCLPFFFNFRPSPCLIYRADLCSSQNACPILLPSSVSVLASVLSKRRSFILFLLPAALCKMNSGTLCEKLPCPKNDYFGVE